MARIVLFLVVFAAAVLAVAAVMSFLRVASGPAPRPRTEVADPMPDAIRMVAYVLLLVLMVGVATGWLGAA